MINLIKKVFKKIMSSYNSNSEQYIKYLTSNGCKVGKGTYFFDAESCVIDRVRLDYVSIGEYCKITSGFTLLAHDYSFSVLSHTHKNLLPPGGEYTKIGNNCFIGINTTVLKGVTIGDNVIIGACSLVTKDIPSNTVYAGNPAKFIMTLDEYYDKRLAAYSEDVKRNMLHMIKLKKRNPTVEECNLYSFLFLERTKENFNNYITKLKLPGNDLSELEHIFYNSKPQYSGYEEFIKEITS